MYFKNFPQVKYSFQGSSNQSQTAVNLMIAAKFVDLFPERSTKCYIDYVIKDGEMSEHVAQRVYNKPDYNWIILLSNTIYNPFFDWPMSQDQLESYVSDKYAGSTLFFSCIGSTAATFQRSSNSTYLTPEQSSFVVGNEVTQQQDSISVTGTVAEWDPTYRKLVVTDVEGGAFSREYAVNSDNSEGVAMKTTPIRTLSQNTDAVHHFIDDFNNILDPYAKINYYEYDDRKVYATENIFYDNPDGIPSSTSSTSSNDFMLSKYIHGGIDSYAITNRMHETYNNDNRRKIKILRPEYAATLIADIEKVFK
jgi:hypothetical protein